ncbi:hypothetical protein [Victivallis sp. Marseille-Q1083]|uniref:hypothetical protein n=1 Tax=Victivallis sp. Marseille-Q1083 TaxID=2717288 RepID=UPI001589AB25|nr:hypothetical protein [Victivallis sp. Marseille-Q1083]
MKIKFLMIFFLFCVKVFGTYNDQLQDVKDLLRLYEHFHANIESLDAKINNYTVRVLEFSVAPGEAELSWFQYGEKHVTFGGYDLKCYFIELLEPSLREYIEKNGKNPDLHRLRMGVDRELQKDMIDYMIHLYPIDALEDINFSFLCYIAWRYYYESEEYSFYTYLLLNNLCSTIRAFEVPMEFMGERALLTGDSALWWENWPAIKPQLWERDKGYISQTERYLFLYNYPSELRYHLLRNGDDGEKICSFDPKFESFCTPNPINLSAINLKVLLAKSWEKSPTIRELFLYLMSDYSFNSTISSLEISEMFGAFDHSFINKINGIRLFRSFLPFEERFAFVRETIDNRLSSGEYSADSEAYAAGMMAAFVVWGYDFDRETGIYTLTERGRQLLDWLMKYPSSYNARKVKILYDHGNLEFLTDLMKKYDNQADWEKLFAGVAAEESTTE